MNSIIIPAFGLIVLFAILLPVLALCARSRKLHTHAIAANITTGTHESGALPRRADAAITTRYLLVKPGSDADHIAVSGASDIPLGVCPDEPSAAEELTAVHLLGTYPGTLKMVAGGSIAHGALVSAAANGKVITLPTGAGTYHIVGRSVNRATAADNDVIEVAHCFPIQRVVAG